MARLIKPEDEEVCLRYILKCSTRRGRNIFKLFDTSEKDNLVASRRRWLERQEEEVAVQERRPDEWQNIEYQGVVAGAPPVLRCSKWRSKRKMKLVKRYLKSFGTKKKSYVLPAVPGGMRS